MHADLTPFCGKCGVVGSRPTRGAGRFSSFRRAELLLVCGIVEVWSHSW